MNRLHHAYHLAVDALLAARAPEGSWPGALARSALSTATAISALAVVRDATAGTPEEPPGPGRFDDLIAGGVAWLVEHQNPDGGWGDTVRSVSNISTTLLARAALHLAGASERHATAVDRAGRSIDRAGGIPAMRARYGADRTFAVPILTNLALAGSVDWRAVEPLPFELACLPASWFRFARMPVVSYALPALIAIGIVGFAHHPPRGAAVRLIRRLARGRSLRVLETIQPSSGGFLEATPLTSFVAMSLAGCGQVHHPVTRRAIEFLARSAGPDGSWAIDSNLAVWNTTLAVNALGDGGVPEPAPTRAWLLDRQSRAVHPYTGAAAGAWAWTHLPGGVPDADDTAGALLALANLGITSAARAAARRGIGWLLDLQNRDGGWPTFCRGWGHLPFDRSGADLTAHVLRALARWEGLMTGRRLRQRIARSRRRGIDFLVRAQRPDGSWPPLWFGNQHAPDDENLTYGTARVLMACRDLNLRAAWVDRAYDWLGAAQGRAGGWGGAPGVAPSLEETALAVDALAGRDAAAPHWRRGVAWLIDRVESGGLEEAAPIGFYFAKLWYFETLYPAIFAVAALGRARRAWTDRPEPMALTSLRASP